MYQVSYSKGYLKFKLPAGVKADIVQFDPAKVPVLRDIEEAARIAVNKPIGCEKLSLMAKPGDKVCIAFTDITRESPDRILVLPVLEELKKAGVKDEDITFLCAVGMHRPSTEEEKIIKLGEDLVNRYKVIDSEPQNADQLVDLGVTSGGVPVWINKTAYQSNLLIATGVVEPHQYAGYSGGRKTLAVGAAGESTIEYTHGPKMLDEPATRLGRIEGNPFHEAITEIAKRAGLRFIVNAVLNHKKEIVAIKAGEPEKTFLQLVSVAKFLYEVKISKQYDIVIAGAGYPKDSNIYQASRAPTYLYFAPVPPVKERGVIIIPAKCEEGAGAGTGEQRFCNAMKEAPSVEFILEHARKYGYKPGQQRAFIMAKALQGCRIIFTNTVCPELIRQMHIECSDTVEEGFQLACKLTGTVLPEVLIVPHALLTLPVLETS